MLTKWGTLTLANAVISIGSKQREKNIALDIVYQLKQTNFANSVAFRLPEGSNFIIKLRFLK